MAHFDRKEKKTTEIQPKYICANFHINWDFNYISNDLQGF